MTDKANLRDFISDLSKCNMINSQNLEVTVMRVVSLSSFVCFTWFGWQNLSLFKIMPLGLSAWFILSSEWLSSQRWNHVLRTELLLEQIDRSSGKATSFPLYHGTLPWSAQVYDLSFCVYHSHRSVSETREGLDMTQDWLLFSKLIGILRFYTDSSTFEWNLCPWCFVKVVFRL